MEHRTNLKKRLISLFLIIILAAATLPAAELTNVCADVHISNGVGVTWNPPPSYFKYDTMHTEEDADRYFKYYAGNTVQGHSIDTTNSHFVHWVEENTGGWTVGNEGYLTTKKQYGLAFRVCLREGYDWPSSVKALPALTIVPASSVNFHVDYNWKDISDKADISYNPWYNQVTAFIPIDPPDPVDITTAGISDIDEYYEYTGSYIAPDPYIWKNERVLQRGTDYTLTFINHKDPGRAELYISGKDDFNGIVLKRYRITFKDVPTSHSYFNDVCFVSDYGIAKGYTGDRKGYFGISDEVTRGQAVMMLWRMQGEPAPKSNKQTFKDVPTSHNFYKAIQWAYEQGIAGGYSGSKKDYFGPGDSCTRGQIMTFLWRIEGKPEPADTNTTTFSDVPPGHNFYKAIQWAYELEITGGYSDGTFKPNKTCTRGHCARFIYRAPKG